MITLIQFTEQNQNKKINIMGNNSKLIDSKNIKIIDQYLYF